MGAVVDYEYVPGPYRQEVGDIDWICLTSAEATFHHIRIHDLKMEDSLSYFMSTMASTPAALAVVFVNSEEHFRYCSSSIAGFVVRGNFILWQIFDNNNAVLK